MKTVKYASFIFGTRKAGYAEMIKNKAAFIFRMVSMGCILICVLCLMFLTKGFTPVYHEWVYDFTDIAMSLNIRNLVTSVYLGPRMFDTFLEVMVVVLTVFGIKFVRSRK